MQQDRFALRGYEDRGAGGIGQGRKEGKVGVGFPAGRRIVQEMEGRRPRQKHHAAELFRSEGRLIALGELTKVITVQGG